MIVIFLNLINILVMASHHQASPHFILLHCIYSLYNFIFQSYKKCYLEY